MDSQSTGPSDQQLTFVIALDLDTKQLKKVLKTAYNGCYPIVEGILAAHGFQKQQGTLYVGRQRSRSDLLAAIERLLDLDWFLPSVKQFRAFQVFADWGLDALMNEIGQSASEG